MSLKRKDQSTQTPKEKDTWKGGRLGGGGEEGGRDGGREGGQERRRGTSEYAEESSDLSRLLWLELTCEQILRKIFAYVLFNADSNSQRSKEFRVSSWPLKYLPFVSVLQDGGLTLVRLSGDLRSVKKRKYPIGLIPHAEGKSIMNLCWGIRNPTNFICASFPRRNAGLGKAGMVDSLKYSLTLCGLGLAGLPYDPQPTSLLVGLASLSFRAQPKAQRWQRV